MVPCGEGFFCARPSRGVIADVEALRLGGVFCLRFSLVEEEPPADNASSLIEFKWGHKELVPRSVVVTSAAYASVAAWGRTCVARHNSAHQRQIALLSFECPAISGSTIILLVSGRAAAPVACLSSG